jgi:hypothetical protein
MTTLRHRVTTLTWDVRMVVEANSRHVPRARILRSYVLPVSIAVSIHTMYRPESHTVRQHAM